MKSLRNVVRAVRAIGAELIFLFFCVGIFLQVGETKGPVFDSIGPDVIPQTLAIFVILLVLVQILLNVARMFSTRPEAVEPKFNPRHFMAFIFFILATATFLLALRFWVAPIVFLTPAFIIVTTLIFSYDIKVQTILIGSIVGVALGFLQYLVFTNFIHVDLYIAL
ncbi:MAG: hypothetical protein P8P84_19725 [Paracoccaceae bacterium]|nr:hypothetical protein [Paracoccaceae bacterium]